MQLPTTMTGSINYISDVSSWTTMEEYDWLVIENFLTSQGKGEGGNT
jgi:hypothetical protein